MKYCIRTTGERDLASFSSIEYTPLFDYEHKPVQSMIAQLKEISNEDCVFMEDDIILCSNFEDKIMTVIRKNPTKIINFYYQPLQYQISKEITGSQFLYNQCVYYPKGVAYKIACEMEKLLNEGFKFDQYDRLQAKAMERLGLTFYSYRPMLVQHKGIKSLLKNHFLNSFRTIYFIDDLDELGLRYDDCKSMLEYTYRKMKGIVPNYVPPRVNKKK